jgi:transposase-like protein
VQGVSTRKVKAVTEELCGHEFSASAVSRLNVKMDEMQCRFAERPADEEYPYVILDARYENVREDGIVAKRAVLIALGVNMDGRRCVLGVALANREAGRAGRIFSRRWFGAGCAESNASSATRMKA